MELLSVPRILISGLGSGVGKAMLGVGLTHELRRRGVSVSCCVRGPNINQALMYKRLSGRQVRCLDDRLLSSTQNLAAVYFASVGADLILIHGDKGLFDGPTPGAIRGSDADLAALIRTPVVLVVDARGLGTSIAALTKGFVELAKGFSVAGVIANRVSAKSKIADQSVHIFNEALQNNDLPKTLGYLPEMAGASELPGREPRQLDSATSLPMQFLIELGAAVAKYVDIDGLMAKAKQAIGIKLSDFNNEPRTRKCRIAVAEDSCFGLHFQDNLDLLRYYGAEVVTFSPLADAGLPKKIGAVYMTGAYLSEYAKDLSGNSDMRAALRQFHEKGGVIYSEGSGTAFLCDKYRLHESKEEFNGVGVIPGIAVPRKRQFAYRELATLDDSILGRAGLILRGISTSEWSLEHSDRIENVFRVNLKGAESLQEGFSPSAQVVSTFLFNHFGSNPDVARNFVDNAAVVEKL